MPLKAPGWEHYKLLRINSIYLNITRTAARVKNRTAVESFIKPKCFCINLENMPEVAPKSPRINTAINGTINARL
jgi:hypothetical protein